jgi:hypothetical protein
VMAVSQRPGSIAALVTPYGPPAWKTIPSWYPTCPRRQPHTVVLPARRVRAHCHGAFYGRLRQQEPVAGTCCAKCNRLRPGVRSRRLAASEVSGCARGTGSTPARPAPA